MRFSPEFLDELKSRLRLSDVIGRKVALKRQGREFAGLSPFTNEKTPSFFVNDDKGFFHCFSSGKHGDLISFLQETERLSFHEAVERLAAEAGMALPARNEDDGAQKKRQSLYEALAASASYFSAQLRRAGGRGARDYLERRGVEEGLIEEFAIGLAPQARRGLCDHLLAKGFSEQALVDSGMAIKPDRGEIYDRFRNRIMFPITGARARVIAFGGRALDADVPAKYLNSPETPLFHKSDVLYNYGAARKALAETGAEGPGAGGLIVCEGYMDVIGLARAGLRHAVAPLGTALTERQIGLLWRAGGEPVLCFDGDAAGRRAAHRSMDRALPLLAPDRSLSFAFLPAGQDPDDVTRTGGACAFEAILKGRQPLAEAIWERETAGLDLSTPERRAGLKARLRELARAIVDEDVRDSYRSEFEARLDALFAPARRSRGSAEAQSGRRAPYPDRRAAFRGGGKVRMGPSAELRRTAPRTLAAGKWRREGVLVLTLVNHPHLLERAAESFAEAPIGDPDLDALRAAILKGWSERAGLDGESLRDHVKRCGCAAILKRLDEDSGLKMELFAQRGASAQDARAGWIHAFSRHLQDVILNAELRDAAADVAREMTEDSFERLRSIVAQRRAGAGAYDVPERPEGGI